MSDNKVVETRAAAGMPRVGVIGGDRLVRMMQETIIALGIELRVPVEAPDSTTSQVALPSVVGATGNADAVLALTRYVDAVTMEHEHMPDEILAVAAGVAPVYPGASALAFIQDKLLMRRKLTDAGIECSHWLAARNDEEIASALRELGGWVAVKAPRDRYDGKGVVEIRSASGGRCETLAPVGQWPDAARDEGLFIEELILSMCETSQFVVHRPGDEIASWCAVEVIQCGGVCVEIVTPTWVSSDVAGRAADVTKAIAEELGMVGMLAVEMFVDDARRVLVNELAMRPHNSDHWTTEGVVTSQFERCLRAVFDLPFGSTDLLTPWAMMVNLLGSELKDPRDTYPEAMALYPSAKIYVYGKEVRSDRKLGHVIVCGDDLGAARAQACETVEALAGCGASAGSPTARD